MVTLPPFISEQLIIKACNTPGGTGGVFRWNQDVGRRTVAIAKSKAPVGNALNRVHDGFRTGCYRDGFEQINRGNQHVTQSIVFNSCPHAEYVEGGRGSTSGRGYVDSSYYERFSWTGTNGRIIRSRGTIGFAARPTLFPALEEALRLGGMDKTRSKQITLAARRAALK